MKLKNVLLLALIAIMVVGVATAAAAQSPNPFALAADKLADIFYGVRTVVYVAGAFVLIGMAWGAFTGRIKWTSVGVMAIGLGILMLAGQILSYATTAEVGVGQGAQDSRSVDIDGW